MAALALAEAACIWLWIGVLGMGLSSQPLGGLLALIVPAHALAGLFASEAVRRSSLPSQRHAAVLFALAGGAIALTVGLLLVMQPVGSHGGALALVGSGLTLLWWRGAVLADDDFAHSIVLAEWRRLTVLFALGLLAGSATLSPASGIGFVALIFLGCGLVALAAAWRHGMASRPPISMAWGLTLGGVLLAVFGPALLGTALLGPSAVAALGQALSVLGNAVFFVLTPLLLAISWLVATLIGALVSLLPRAKGRPRVPSISPAQLSRQGGPHPATINLGPWLPWVELGLILGLALLVFVLLRRSVHARSVLTSHGEQPREEREGLLSWRDAWRAVMAWLRRLGRRTESPPVPSAAVESDGGLLSPTTLTVREIYRRLLALGASLGTVRAATETPHDYLARLRGRITEREKEVSVITATYVQVRYGPAPATPEQAERAQVAWERLIGRPRGEDS